MQKSVFLKKAEQMGDFYMYYQKPSTNVVTFGVCTMEVNDYISNRSRGTKVADDEVLLWNWRYNSPLKVKYASIKKLTPLSAVLKNDDR